MTWREPIRWPLRERFLAAALDEGVSTRGAAAGDDPSTKNQSASLAFQNGTSEPSKSKKPPLSVTFNASITSSNCKAAS